MESKWTDQVTDNSPYCIAQVRIITNESGVPIDYTYVNVNDSYAKVIKLNREDIIGKRALEISPRVTTEGFNWISFLGRVGLHIPSDETIQLVNNKNDYIHIVAYQLKKKEVAFSFINISKEMNQNQLHEHLFDLTPSPIIVLSLEGIIVRVNKEWQNLFDYTPEFLQNKSMFDFIYEEDKEVLINCINSIRENEATCTTINRIRTNDGHYKEISWKAYRTHNHILAAGVDLTEIKKKERKLQQQVDLQNFFIHTTLIGVIQLIYDEPFFSKELSESPKLIEQSLYHERIVSANQAYANQLHEKSEDLIGRSAFQLFHRDIEVGRDILIQSLFKDQVRGEYKSRLKDGTLSWFYADITTLKDSKGRITGHLVLQIDINDRKEREEALKQSETQYKFLSEYASDVIWAYNTHVHKFIYISPAIKNILGWLPEDLLDEDYSKTIYTDDISIVRESMKLWLNEFKTTRTISKQQILQLRHYSKDESLVWIESTINFRLNDEGFIEVIGVSRDISKKKKAEDDLLYSNYHDQLTNVYNRRYVNEQLEKFLSHGLFPITIVTCDVNGLKLTNDVFGHSVGDTLLRKTGELLKSFAKGDAFVAREGGDEFLMLLPRTNKEEALTLIQSIKTKSDSIHIENTALSLSFGCAVMESELDSYKNIYSIAEAHLYRSKLVESPLYKQGIITLLITTLFEKHKDIELHSERVAILSQLIAKKLSLDKHDVDEIYLAGKLHDIGKIALDETLLDYRTDFTKDQIVSFQRHSELGFHILKSVQHFGNIAEWVLSHHERPDGKGYPRGLTLYQIPLPSRIIHVANKFDMAFQTYPEKNSEAVNSVFQMLNEAKGTKYDTRVLQALESLPLDTLIQG